MVFKSGVFPDIYQYIKKKTFKGEWLKFPSGRKMSQLGVKLLSWVKIAKPMARNYFFDSVFELLDHTKSYQVRSCPLFITVH